MGEVKVGQVWADNDPRAEGRTLKVLEVHANQAECEILTNSDLHQEQLDDHAAGRSQWYKPVDRRGKTTTISLSRFKPTSTGYRLVKDMSDG